MNNKKIISYFLLSLVTFQIIISASLVAAQTASKSVVTEPTWVVNIAKFLGFVNASNEVTWAIIIASLAVLAIIFAATYDILGFTAFESIWVKYVISAGIALIVAVADGITFLTAFIMGIAGGSIAIGTTLAIILAIVFFIASTFLKGLQKTRRSREQALNARGAYTLAAEAKSAEAKEARRLAKEARENRTN